MTATKKTSTLKKKPTKTTATKPKQAETRYATFFDVVAERLSHERLITLRGEVDSNMYAHAAHSLNFLESVSHEPIEIELMSGGGSVHDGLGIFDKIKQIQSKGVDVNVTVFGYAFSMAVPILQAGTKRRAGLNASFLLHEVSYNTRGTHQHNKDLIETTEKLALRLNRIVADRSKLSVEQIEEMTRRRDHTIDAETALSYGLIDELI